MKGSSIIIAVALTTASAFAQSPAPQPTEPRVQAGNSAGTGVIRGRVVQLDTREPLKGVDVRITAQGARDVPATITDPAGRFEIQGLAAAQYTLTASKPGFITLQYGQQRPHQQGRPIDLGAGDVLESIDIHLPRGSSVAGVVLDAAGEPVTGALVQLLRQRWVRGQRQWTTDTLNLDRTDDLGQFRLHGISPGTYLVAATVPHPTMATGQIEAWSSGVGGASTFYPGTTSTDQAQAVAVGLGEEIVGLSLTYVEPARASISGTVRNEDGSPATGVGVSLRQQMPFSPGGTSSMGMRLSPDGGFRITDLAPGRYRLSVSAPFGGMALETVVHLDGADLEVPLILTRGGAASGRVVFEGHDTPPALSRFGVSVRARPEDPDMRDAERSATARDDWTFVVLSLSGRRVLDATAPAGWMVKSIRHGGQDITGQVLDFDAGDVEGLEVVLTDKVTTVSGQVMNDDGTAALDATIVLLARDAARWGPDSRYVAAVRPNQQGRFTQSALPRGDYVAVAVDDLEPGDETNPEMLERLRDLGVPFALEEGEATTLDLTLTRLQ
jgi:hypothetical protein